MPSPWPWFRSPTSVSASATDALEIDEIHQKFIRCDEEGNQDGKLTEDECDGQWDGQFGKVDVDGNGEVTWKEMEEAATEILKAKKEAEKAKDRLYRAKDFLEGTCTWWC